MIHHESPPTALAACTYSRLRSEMTSPRTSRAVPSQDSAVSSRMIISRLGAKMFTRISSSTRPGTASSVSMTRIITMSTIPPTQPAIAPYSVPITVVAIATAKPSSSDDWPPTIRRPSTSYP